MHIVSIKYSIINLSPIGVAQSKVSHGFMTRIIYQIKNLKPCEAVGGFAKE